MTASIAPSIQYSFDGPGTLDAGDDGLTLLWNNALGKFVPGAAGVSDHGGLTGLGDDDHAQYALLAGRAGGQTLTGDTASGGALTLNSTSHATKGFVSFNGGLATIGADGRLAVRQIGLNGASAPGAGYIAWPATGGGLYSGATTLIGQDVTTRGWYFVVNGVATLDVNQTSAYLRVPLLALTAATVPFTVKLAASQSANALEVNTTAGSGGDVLRVTAAGGLVLPMTGAVLQIGGGGQISMLGSTSMKLVGGGTLTLQDASSQTLATFIHNSGGTLRNAGTTRIAWDPTGIGFFGATPVARPTPADHVAAIAALDTLGLTAGSPALSATQLLLPYGAVGAPSIAFGPDTDTGFRSQSAGDLRAAANGSDVFQFTAAANTSMRAFGISNTYGFTVSGGLSTFNPLNSAGVVAIFKGAVSQSGNYIECNSSAGSGGDVLRVTAAGALTAAGILTLPAGSASTGAHAINIASGGGFNAEWDGSKYILRLRGMNARLAMSITEVSSAAAVGFFGVTPVVRPTALTAADAGALNTGDAGSDTVIGNMRTRIGELEAKLQALGLLT